MNTDQRRAELLSKANSMIDTISESMRTIENVEGAKSRFLRADSTLSLEIPIEGVGGMSDVFKFEEIFDERGIEKIKAYILTQLEFLEDGALQILEKAGFSDVIKPEDIPFAPDPSEEWEDVAEDDSDMIVVPEKFEKGHHSRKPLPEEKVEEINKLTAEGVRPKEIAEKTGVSYQSAVRYSNKYVAGTKPEDKKTSGRSASKR